MGFLPCKKTEKQRNPQQKRLPTKQTNFNFVILENKSAKHQFILLKQTSTLGRPFSKEISCVGDIMSRDIENRSCQGASGSSPRVQITCAQA